MDVKIAGFLLDLFCFCAGYALTGLPTMSSVWAKEYYLYCFEHLAIASLAKFPFARESVAPSFLARLSVYAF